jgi:hypothetical protein
VTTGAEVGCGDGGKVSVAVEALDYGFNLLNIVKGWGIKVSLLKVRVH